MSLDVDELKKAKRYNRLHTLFLLVSMTGFMWVLADWLFGAGSGGYAAIAVLIMLLINPMLPPEFILRAYRANPIRPSQAPELHSILQTLAQRADLPIVPVLYYLPVGTMNALAMGSPNASIIALSDGLLRRLNIEEISAVLAHEISHIRHHDIKIMMLSDMIGQLIRLFSLTAQILLVISLPAALLGIFKIDWLALLVIITAPFASALIQLAISRRRELLADISAAQLMGSSMPLIRALTKLDQQGSYWERLYRASSDNAWLRTHPKTSERVAQLQSLEIGEHRYTALQVEQWRQPWQARQAIKPRRISRYFWF